MFTTTVAGVTHKNADGTSRQDIIRKHVKPGVPLVLKREPDNRHDADAVAVWLVQPALQIGYLKSGIGNVATRMDEGEVHSARVLELTGGTKDYPARGVAIEVWQGGPDDLPASAVEREIVIPVKPEKVKPRRSLGGKIAVGCGGLIVLTVAFGIIGALLPDTPEQIANRNATATARALASIAQAEAATATPSNRGQAAGAPTPTSAPPTATSAPTATAQPTPEPTATPEPLPTETPVPAPTAVPPTPAPTPTEGPSPTPLPPPPTRDPRKPSFAWNWGEGTQDGNACICGGPDLNCADFVNWEASQACFEKCGGSASTNVFGLDNNNNAVVCENPK